MRSFALGLLFVASAVARAADAEYKIVRVTPTAEGVSVRLPLTDVTGKVRVKEKKPNEMAVPVSPLKVTLGDDDYLEWQIGYDTLDAQHPSLAARVSFKRKGQLKYGCELSKILVEAYRLEIVTADQLRSVRSFLQETLSSDLEKNAKLKVGKAASASAAPAGFSELVEEIPMVVKETEFGRVEIQLKQRQRGVGNQAMVYVCLDVSATRNRRGELRPASPARSKETVTYTFTKKHADFLLDIVRAFGLASHQHNEDLTHILDCILAEN